jgi:hypothetical protein
METGYTFEWRDGCKEEVHYVVSGVHTLIQA